MMGSETLTFPNPDFSDAQKANFAPEGSNYVGIFSAGSLSVSPGGASIETILR